MDIRNAFKNAREYDQEFIRKFRAGLKFAVKSGCVIDLVEVDLFNVDCILAVVFHSESKELPVSVSCNVYHLDPSKTLEDNVNECNRVYDTLSSVYKGFNHYQSFYPPRLKRLPIWAEKKYGLILGLADYQEEAVVKCLEDIKPYLKEEIEGVEWFALRLLSGKFSDFDFDERDIDNVDNWSVHGLVNIPKKLGMINVAKNALEGKYDHERIVYSEQRARL